ncbi:MAG: tRNA (guanine(46)-N(7))-methyltransferase TrmB [Janthinobacterium lividum]
MSDAGPVIPEGRHRSGVLHGRRAGRPLRKDQRARMARDLPSLAIDFATLDDPKALFDTPFSRLRLEVGFGGGEHLAHEAARCPESGFIGCEPFLNGVAKLVERVEALDIDNVRLHAGDAGELLDALPPACLDGADVFYPDPWPKRRQRKRRFLSEDNLDRLARVLKPGAPLRFATDIDDYAGWVLARILRSADFIWEARTADDWRHPWDGWPSTRYEQKAFREGRPPAYFTFKRR